MKYLTIALVIAFAVTLAPAQNFDILAISWGGTSSLIDSTNATSSSFGASGASSLNNMGRDPISGTFYVLTTSGGVLTVDPNTGATTSTGATVSISSCRGLAFDSSGQGYAISDVGFGSIDLLYLVDVVAGTSTLVGPTGLDSIQSLTVDPATGALYVWDVAQGTGPQQLFTLDANTGASTAVGSGQPSGNQIQTLLFDGNGTLYGAYNELYTIDLTTSALTLVGGLTPNDVRGAEFITLTPPQPPTYPGTGEDFVTRVSHNGAPLVTVSAPGTETVGMLPGDTIVVQHVSPNGTFDFDELLAFATIAPIATPVISPFPGLWVLAGGSGVFTLSGGIPGTPFPLPPGGATFAATHVGGALTGNAALIEAAVISPLAANFIFASANGLLVNFN